MRAAVANGADAVYFGLDNFNARHRAANFRQSELPEIIAFLHARNVKAFLTFNTLIFSDELPAAVAYIRAIAAAGVDAVIVQDLGLARLIKTMVPSLHVHGSTQMTLTEPRGIEFVRRTLGVERVVLARELSIDDIRKITAATDTELEVFVHGALCDAYSGQCLTSEALGGRSANRGQCAQACRLPYELIVDGQVRDLGDKAYLLSPQDLAAYDLVGDLAALGVASLKIEGRLKSAHYVAATSQTYRTALDALTSNLGFQISDQQRADLEQTFSRGFTHGFLSGVNHQVLVNARFPKSRGTRIGTVQRISHDTITIALAKPPASAGGILKPGDGVVFDEGHPEQDEQGGRVLSVTSRGKHAVDLVFHRGDVNPAAITVGAIVWKTDDPAIRRRLEHSFSRDTVVHRTPLDAHVTARVGQPLRLILTAGDHSAEAESDKPLEPAQKFPATDAMLREQLDRLGDTPFALRDLTTDLAGGPMVPKSVLNDLRRRAVEQLQKSREHAHEIVRPNALDELRALTPSPRYSGERAGERGEVHDAANTVRLEDEREGASRASAKLPRRSPLSPALSPEYVGEGAEAPRPHGASHSRFGLHLLVRTLEQLHAALTLPEAIRPASIYCDFEDVRRYKHAVAACNAARVPVAVATMRIVKPGEDGWLQQILDCAPDAILVRNLAAIGFFREKAPHLPLIGDYALNIAHELTAQVFAEQNLVRMVPSYDLNWRQLAAMLSRADASRFEAVIHQHMPMFHMEHCVFAHVLSDGKDYRDCGRPCENHRVDLNDRVGQPHPLIPDAGCRNTVFNAQAQTSAEFVPEMKRLGIRQYRVELLREAPHEVAPLVQRYADLLAGRSDARQAVRSLRVLNQLGVTRGTLDR
jgi:putative protease